MAELTGVLQSKTKVMNPDGVTQVTWTKDKDTFYKEWLVFDVNGTKYAGEASTKDPNGSKHEIGKTYSFTHEVSTGNYADKIKGVKDPNATGGGFNGGGKGGGNYETASERAQKRKLDIASASMSLAVQILGPGKTMEEYKAQAETIYSYTLEKGGEVKPAGDSPAADLQEISQPQINAMVSYIKDSFTQPTLGDGIKKLSTVIFGFQRYVLTTASVIAFSEAFLKPTYEPAPNNAGVQQNQQQDINTLGGSRGAMEQAPTSDPRPSSPGKSDDLPF